MEVQWCIDHATVQSYENQSKTFELWLELEPKIQSDTAKRKHTPSFIYIPDICSGGASRQNRPAPPSLLLSCIQGHGKLQRRQRRICEKVHLLGPLRTTKTKRQCSDNSLPASDSQRAARSEVHSANLGGEP